MKLSQASAASGGTPHALSNIQLTTPAGTTPAPVYRRAAYLRFACGDLAQGLRLETPAARLKGSFEILHYDAVDPPAPALKAKLSQLGNGVVVDLAAPRHVVAIDVDPRKLTTKAIFELYRLDGGTPADKPSATASPSFKLRAQESRLELGLTIFQGPSGARMFSADGRAIGFEEIGQSAVGRSFLGGGGAVDFTDARFLLRVKAGGQEIAIAPGDVTQVSIDAYPTGARIGLALPVPAPASSQGSAPVNPPPDPAGATFFWSVPGEVGNAVPAANGQFDLGNALAGALAAGLDRFAEQWRDAGGTTLPAQIDAALVFESDAPCRVQVGDFELTYHLTRTALSPDASEPKRVLRFTALSAPQQVAFELPGKATIARATLRIDDSLRTDRPALPAVAQAQASWTGEGCLLDAGRWAAQVLTPIAAISIQGVSVALLALEADTRVRVALHKDAQDAPLGSVLAEAELDVARAGDAQWPTASLDAALVLATEPVWIVVRAVRGRAVWLCRSGQPALRVLRSADKGGSTRQLESLQGCFLLSSSDAQATSLPQLLSARIGSQPGALDPATSAIDLTAAANAYLAAQASAGVVQVPVTLTATAAGSVTVYPPEVEYDL